MYTDKISYPLESYNGSGHAYINIIRVLQNQIDKLTIIQNP